MGKPGPAERSWVAYARFARQLGAIDGRIFANRRFLRSSGSRPTFAAIHWRVSM
jgi:hypothetical protein